MSLGLIGRKVGMTCVFNDDGSATAVTVIDVSNNRVSQLKTVANDGYAGVQLTFGDKRAKPGRQGRDQQDQDQGKADGN